MSRPEHPLLNTTLALAQALGAPPRTMVPQQAPAPPRAAGKLTPRRVAFALAASLLVIALAIGAVLFAESGVAGRLISRPPHFAPPLQGTRMPANEAQAQQAVIDFYQKTLQNINEDWYWSSDSGAAAIAEEGNSADISGRGNWKFSTSFWLRGGVVDTSETEEHDYPFFDRVISVWERIGWTKTTDQHEHDGTRYVNGHTDTGLEVDLQIGIGGGIGTMCQVRFPPAGMEKYSDGVHHPDGAFPRKITRDGPAPWTPPTTEPTR